MLKSVMADGLSWPMSFCDFSKNIHGTFIILLQIRLQLLPSIFFIQFIKCHLTTLVISKLWRGTRAKDAVLMQVFKTWWCGTLCVLGFRVPAFSWHKFEIFKTFLNDYRVWHFDIVITFCKYKVTVYPELLLVNPHGISKKTKQLFCVDLGDVTFRYHIEFYKKN